MSPHRGDKPRLPVFLIGYMGCGKTTLGQALHSITGMPFVDLDHAVEHEAGMTVRRIFELHGEAGFRRLETSMLRRVSGMRAIVACGGGTPCQPGNIELMNSAGVTVWLQADVDRLTARLAEARRTRPLIAALSDSELHSFVEHNLRQRTPYYSRAAHTFDANALDDAQQIADTTKRFIDQFLKH